MKVICTYCSREKDPARGLMPALDRYLSQRITDLAAQAAEQDQVFRILSGKFGLVPPDVAIPCYDHLLLPGEVDLLSGQVAATLCDLGATQVRYHTAAPEKVINIRPYLAVMEAACSRAGAALSVVILPGNPD